MQACVGWLAGAHLWYVPALTAVTGEASTSAGTVQSLNKFHPQQMTLPAADAASGRVVHARRVDQRYALHQASRAPGHAI